MNLIIICGPPASGKMTVGQELKKITDYKLLHNHMSLELVNEFFDFGTPNFKNLDKKIRFDIFEEISNSDITGLIFTFVWAFNESEDEMYIDNIVNVFNPRNPKVYFVELDCDLEKRLERNRSENRLKHKPSKRDVKASEQRLLKNGERYRMNSKEGEFKNKTFYKINNTNLTAHEVAEKIVAEFNLV